MKTTIYLAAMLAFTCTGLFAQTPQTETKTPEKNAIKFDCSGMIVVAKDSKSNLFLTFGGPGLKLSFGKNVALTVGMYPSLKYNYEFSETVDKTPLATILGTGVQLSYKHITGGCMFYSIRNLWFAAPAIGYKFK